MEPGIRDPRARDWFERRTYRGASLPLDELVARKRERDARVSVCLPSLNEQATIGAICEQVRTELLQPGVVDELIVVDSGSNDRSREVARAAGATVHRVDDLLPEHGRDGGKGAALWKSVAAATGDIVVWVDSDIRDFEVAFVTRLLVPLLQDEAVVLAKGFYERPLQDGRRVLASSGARVTEIAVRPLLNLLHPSLSAVIQPLAGETAIRRDAAARLSFFTGYAVDLGLLIDVGARFGVDAIAQVDLGRRIHSNQDVLALGRMTHQIFQVILRRLEDGGRLKLADDVVTSLTQFVATPAGAQPRTHELSIDELPPLVDLL